MKINVKQVIGLPVETQTGISLGKVVGINLEITSHVVNEYVVRHGFLNSQEFLIKPIQIISISQEKMIVEDGIVKEEEGVIQKKVVPAGVVSGAMRVENE